MLEARENKVRPYRFQVPNNQALGIWEILMIVQVLAKYMHTHIYVYVYVIRYLDPRGPTLNPRPQALNPQVGSCYLEGLSRNPSEAMK